MPPKELIVVGGPNGAGKTTFADEFVARHGYTYVGADAIAAELSPTDPSRARMPASREFLRRIKVAISGPGSFVVESTLSGRTLRELLKSANRAGFETIITYLFLDSADTCVERVRKRVQKGGHDVPEVDIRRRFSRSARNFWSLYRPLADRWLLVYNSGNEPHDVAVGSANNFSVRDRDLFAKFKFLVEVNPP